MGSRFDIAIIAGAVLEKRPDIAETLHASFGRMLARYRAVQSVLQELAPKPKPPANKFAAVR
jgi:hypothetical protein